MIGIFPTHIFQTYAAVEEEGIMGDRKKYVLVLADETRGGIPVLYFFTGIDLLLLSGTVTGNNVFPYSIPFNLI